MKQQNDVQRRQKEERRALAAKRLENWRRHEMEKESVFTAIKDGDAEKVVRRIAACSFSHDDHVRFARTCARFGQLECMKTVLALPGARLVSLDVVMLTAASYERTACLKELIDRKGLDAVHPGVLRRAIALKSVECAKLLLPTASPEEIALRIASSGSHEVLRLLLPYEI